jgi:diguanylate cyclase (GGDEF)-like protein
MFDLLILTNMPYIHNSIVKSIIGRIFFNCFFHSDFLNKMNEINAIIQRLKDNEEIARKFHEVEKKILTILKYKDLFEVLLLEIKNQFKVPYAWISMIENSEVSSLIESLDSSDILKEHINTIDKTAFKELTGNYSKPLLVNEDLKPYFKLLPQSRSYLIKSLAIAPISLDGEIIGSLNQASSSKTRFEPGIDTSLLEQLASKVSLCLSNVTAHEKLEFLAYHDPLTGLLNRRVMEKVLNREFYRAQRYSSALSLAFMDLDFFKRINDNFGHERGDDILKYVADTLVNMSRDSDIVARFAGDEFIMILPETDRRKADFLMDRIQLFLRQNPLNVEKIAIPITISCGIASTPDKDIDNPATFLKKADEMLYEKKRSRANYPDGAAISENHNIINISTASLERENRKDSDK